MKLTASTGKRPASNGQEPTMFLLEGMLTELNVELGTQNLFQRIDARYRGKAAATGAGAVAGDLFGQAATAASLAMYDGEDTQNFLCLIDGQPVCGQFGGAEWLKPGNRVRAVVTKHENVLCAHAIMDEATGLLWITHPWGSKAEARANWKIAWWCYLFAMICIGIASAIFGAGSSTWLESMIHAGGIAALLMFVMTFWTSGTMRSLSDPSTEMFRLLGFARPASVNLNGHRMSLFEADEYLDCFGLRPPTREVSAMYEVSNVYLYKRAIEDGKVSLSPTSPR